MEGDRGRRSLDDRTRSIRRALPVPQAEERRQQVARLVRSRPNDHSGMTPPICADMGGWSEGLGCVSCLVRLVASRLLSHGDDSLPLGVSVSEVAHSVRDLVERVGPAYDGGDIRGFDQLFEHQQVRFVRR